MGVREAAPQCSPDQPLGSSPPAVISGRRALSVEASTPQAETPRSRARLSPHGQDRQQALSPGSRTHCASVLTVWDRALSRPGRRAAPAPHRAQSQLPSSGLYPGSGRLSPRSLGMR